MGLYINLVANHIHQMPINEWLSLFLALGRLEHSEDTLLHPTYDIERSGHLALCS